MLRVVVKRIGQEPVVEEIKGDLKTMQDLVGGYIQVVPIGSLLLVCNEEGKLDGLQPNFPLGDDIIVGDAFFTKDGVPGEFGDLNDIDIERTKCYLKQVMYR